MFVSQTMIIYTLKLIRNIYTVHLVIKLCVVKMINTANQFKFIEVKMLYTNLWKNCLKRLNIVNILLNTNSTSHEK